MANTTNFGWETPDDTDLVKDGAAAMRTLGNAIDTSFVDLKGGTTGQILSKASNTDLDYAWVDNQVGDITAVTAGTGLSGGGSSGDITLNLANTAVSAGSYTNSNITVDAQGRITPASSGSAGMFAKNPVLNSNFSVWQRGTSIAQTGAAIYSADRWCVLRALGVTGSTYSRQLTNDTTNLPNIQYCARVQRDSGNTNTGRIYIAQSMETVNSIPFSGKQVTLSFYARKGANFSATSNILQAQLIYGTGTDQNNLSGYTGEAAVISQSATLTSTWQRFSYTATVPTSSTELCVRFYFDPTGTASTADYFEITGVQLEASASATDYYPNGNTYQGELAACQRYYYRQTSGTTYGTFATGAISSTTGAYCGTTFPVQMRVAPTSFEYSSLRVTDKANFGVAVTSASLSTADTTPNLGMAQYIVASGLTAYRPCFIDSNNISTGYIAFNAEL